MTIALDPELAAADILVHEAAHAVIAWELAIRIGNVTVDLANGRGRMTFASDLAIDRYLRGSEALRRAAQRDMLVLHAGFVAQQRFHYENTLNTIPQTDWQAVLATGRKAENDLALIDAWSAYAVHRVCSMLESRKTWRRVRALAVELAWRPIMRGDEIERFLSAVRTRDANDRLAVQQRAARDVYCVLDGPAQRNALLRAIRAAQNKSPACGSLSQWSVRLQPCS